MLRLEQQSAPCYPVSVSEVKTFLSISESSHTEDNLLSMLIASASHDAEVRTGRVFVQSKWSWTPDVLIKGVPMDFPICPVTKVEIFDLDAKERIDISSELVVCKLPSLDPLGTPLLGSLQPIAEFPINYEMLLTVGYPVQENSADIVQTTSPEIVSANTTYTATRVHLVFDREVTGVIKPEHFSVTSGFETRQPTMCSIEKGGVSLLFDVDFLTEGGEATVQFIGGVLKDSFGNFVQPIIGASLPIIAFSDVINAPEEAKKAVVYTSDSPMPVKQWILVRIGTLYSQRSELTPRSGNANGLLYPEAFINYLLSPYKVRHF